MDVFQDTLNSLLKVARLSEAQKDEVVRSFFAGVFSKIASDYLALVEADAGLASKKSVIEDQIDNALELSTQGKIPFEQVLLTLNNLIVASFGEVRWAHLIGESFSFHLVDLAASLYEQGLLTDEDFTKQQQILQGFARAKGLDDSLNVGDKLQELAKN